MLVANLVNCTAVLYSANNKKLTLFRDKAILLTLQKLFYLCEKNLSPSEINSNLKLVEGKDLK